MNHADCRPAVSKSKLTRIQFLCLMVAVIFEGLMIFIGKSQNRILYKPFHIGLLVCCFLFFGTMILQMYKQKARYPLLFPFAMAVWFTLIQLQHSAAGMTTQPYGMFLSTYLFAYPFASVTQDAKKQVALKTAAFVYIAATLILVLYTFLLVFDRVPAFLVKRLFWNSYRLTVVHHPNITARAFLISFAFCLGFALQFPQRWAKGLFYAASALMFFALSLTSSRSAIFLACLFFGGVIFLALCQRNRKYWIYGAAAGLAAVFCLFFLSQSLFQWNLNRLVEAEMPYSTSVPRIPGSTPEKEPSEEHPYRILLLSQSNQTAEDTTENTANGKIVPEDGGLYYYEDGVRTYAGLIRIDGDYYYVNSKCMVVTGRYEISKTNGLMDAGTYLFDESGKMIPAKNGIVAEDGGLYYYEDSVRTYAGLIQIDGDYYYVNSKCMVVTGRYAIDKTNGLMDKGVYLFDETGKMIPAKNGIVEENGLRYYYVAGEKTYAGLILIDGDYYYVNSDCMVVTGRYPVHKTNGLMEVGVYPFDESGRLVTDPVAAESITATPSTTAAQSTFAQDLPSLNGRTNIWKATIRILRENPSILWRGCDSTAKLLEFYRVSHTHNSWLEILARLGLPAFLIALMFTLQAVRACLVLFFHPGADLWKKHISLLVLCLLVSGFLEPTLFFTEEVWHYVDFLFFLCLGYLNVWRKQASSPKEP